MTRGRYGRVERDQSFEKLPVSRIVDLSDAERCLIYRRRLGVTQQEVANALKVSRFWVNAMERGRENCARLTEFWESAHDL